MASDALEVVTASGLRRVEGRGPAQLESIVELATRALTTRSRWHPGELVSFWFLDDAENWERVASWSLDGRCVAWARVGRSGRLDLQVDATAPEVLDEVLEWFDRAPGARQVVTCSNVEESLLAELRRRGKRSASAGPVYDHLWCDLEADAAAPLRARRRISRHRREPNPTRRQRRVAPLSVRDRRGRAVVRLVRRDGGRSSLPRGARRRDGAHRPDAGRHVPRLARRRQRGRRARTGRHRPPAPTSRSRPRRDPRCALGRSRRRRHSCSRLRSRGRGSISGNLLRRRRLPSAGAHRPPRPLIQVRPRTPSPTLRP